MRKLFALVVAALLLQACAGGSPGAGAGDGDGAPGSPGAPPSENPGSGQQESADFFSAIDGKIASSITGDKFVTERFYIAMSRLSVFALICDFKNTKGYSAKVSKLWNASTKLQSLAEKVYGGEKAAYNRFEKQRNVESNRLSFESDPNVCAISEASFIELASLSASGLSRVVRETPRGKL